VPTFLSLKVPDSPVVSKFTVSPVTTPTNDTLVVIIVAVALPSYILLSAVIPLTVRALVFTVRVPL